MKTTRKTNKRFPADAAGLTAAIFFLSTTALFLLFATCFPQFYILSTYEDLPGEWTQVFFFTVTLIGAILLARRDHPHGFFFMLLAMACFYVIGEEISWGQRLLSFASPEFFQQHNLQQEANLHNLFTGPVSTWKKRMIEYVLVAGLVGYGLIYPLLRKKNNKIAGWMDDHGLPVPPLYLSPYFIGAAFCEVRIFSFNEAEVAELLIAMALAFLTLHYNYLSCKQKKTAGGSRPLALIMVWVVIASMTGAGVVSWSFWNSPELHEKMVQRITAGQIKFGRRYSRFGAWHHAATLYEEALATHPKNTSLLRKLAVCYRELGDEKRFTATTGRAIRLDMIHYSRNPDLVSVNLSLFQDFQQIGNQKKARFHLERALSRSHDKVLLEPYNAGNFYWYGKCLQARGETIAAREQFARAVTMKPESAKYRRAYLNSLQGAVDS